MPGSSGRRSRSTSHSGWAGAGKPQREMAALILAQGEQNGNLEMISHGESKALLQVANKPQLYYSIKQLEQAGFEKSLIYVAISEEDLESYESDERVIPIESRLPARNLIRVEDFQSSVDSLRKAVAEIDKLDGIPEFLLVIYVDVISCGVLSKLADINRVRDSAFLSVYGPRDLDIKDVPGDEDVLKKDKVSKLVFFGGEGVYKDKSLRKLYLTIDTENYPDENIRMSRRVLAKSDHLEISSDLDDQGVFLIRNDLQRWVLKEAQDKNWFSIREDLIPALLRAQYTDQLSDDVECLAVIDEHSTCRLDSITHYVSAHRHLIERRLLSKFMPENCNLSPGLRNFDVCSSSIIGENVSRFNEIETRDRIATELAEGEGNRKDSESGSLGGDKESKVFISKSIVGPKCQFEYDLSDNKKKTTRITNCFIHNEVKIRTGVKLNNCIISRGAVLGEQCTLSNCIVGPFVVVESEKNLKNKCLKNEED